MPIPTLSFCRVMPIQGCYSFYSKQPLALDLKYLGGQNFKTISLTKKLVHDDAANAIKFLIKEFFSEFRFKENSADRNLLSVNALNAVALLLTAIIRKNIDIAPGFLLNANIQGSGKTTLAQIIYIILTGCDMPVSSLPKSSEESKKEMLATLMQSPAMVCFDNVRDGSTTSLWPGTGSLRLTLYYS